MSEEDSMTRMLLYATQADLLRVLADVEGQRDLQYVKVGDQAALEPTVYLRAADVPGLGIAIDGWMLQEDRWYALDRAAQVVVDEIVRPGRKTRYFVGARLNPDAVIVAPGGRLGDRGIVQGIINPVSKSKRARLVFMSIMKAFQG